MHKRFYFLLLLLACWRSAAGQGRYQPLPKLAVNRRGDMAYMDSAANLAKQRYRELAALPQRLRPIPFALKRCTT